MFQSFRFRRCLILIVIVAICYVLRLLQVYFLKSESSYFSDIIGLQNSSRQISFHSSNIVYYPASRSYEECRLVYASRTNDCPLDPSSYYFSKYDQIKKGETQKHRSIGYTNATALPYSEPNFRSASHPVLWLDTFGDVRWNEAAEREMYQFLLDKQYPQFSNFNGYSNQLNAHIKDCESRQLILLEQWRNGGFFSRVNCFIEQFGQTLYSPLMALLLPAQFDMASSAEEDFAQEGVLAYYAQMSQCSAYIQPDRLKNLNANIRATAHDRDDQEKNHIRVQTFKQLRQLRPPKKYLWLQEQWKFAYEHVPHRRWLLDRNSYETIASVHYDSPVDVLTDHASEHIYHAPNLNFDLAKWNPRILPAGLSTTHLHDSYQITWQDKVFTTFLRYMFALFFHQLSPRIDLSKNLLVRYWSSYLADSRHQPYNQALSSMAGVYIRRGDKKDYDPFYQKFGYWRNISLYIKAVYDEEKRLNKTFSSIFIMSDDASVVNTVLEFAASNTSGPSEMFARRYLFGRHILYNVYAPDNCRKPFSRFDFDQYLVNVQLLFRHSSFIATEAASNLGYYLERIIYAEKQLVPGIQTNTHIKFAHDSFFNK